MPANMHCARRLSRLSRQEILCAHERWREAPSWCTEHLRSHPGPTGPTLALPLPLLTGCFAPLHPSPSCDGKLTGNLTLQAEEFHPCRRGESRVSYGSSPSSPPPPSLEPSCLTAPPMAVSPVALFHFHLSNPTCFPGTLANPTEQTCKKEPIYTALA